MNFLFRTIRFSFKLDKDKDRILYMTVKDWPTRQKADSYIERFSKVPWFAGAVIETEEGFVLYERTPLQTEYFYEPDFKFSPQLSTYDELQFIPMSPIPPAIFNQEAMFL